MPLVFQIAAMLVLLSAPMFAHAQQPTATGGCASGFCAVPSTGTEATAEPDIDAVEADMKKQLSNESRSKAPAGMASMSMCPCMRMMSMMRGMQSMPSQTPQGLTTPPSE